MKLGRVPFRCRFIGWYAYIVYSTLPERNSKVMSIRGSLHTRGTYLVFNRMAHQTLSSVRALLVEHYCQYRVKPETMARCRRYVIVVLYSVLL